jgi:hypothetical protein
MLETYLLRIMILKSKQEYPQNIHLVYMWTSSVTRLISLEDQNIHTESNVIWIINAMMETLIQLTLATHLLMNGKNFCHQISAYFGR